MERDVAKSEVQKWYSAFQNEPFITPGTIPGKFQIASGVFLLCIPLLYYVISFYITCSSMRINLPFDHLTCIFCLPNCRSYISHQLSSDSEKLRGVIERTG